jgi:hypothetical protein
MAPTNGSQGSTGPEPAGDLAGRVGAWIEAYAGAWRGVIEVGDRVNAAAAAGNPEGGFALIEIARSAMERIGPVVTELQRLIDDGLAGDDALQQQVSTTMAEALDAWPGFWERTLDRLGWTLRPGTDVWELARTTEVLILGIATRPESRREEILARGLAALLVGAVDPGDHMTLEEAVRSVLFGNDGSSEDGARR